MSDYERDVLEHYHLSTPYPVEWPAEKDYSDGSDEEHEDRPDIPRLRDAQRRKRSRFSALERVANDRKGRGLVPGSQKTGAGVENLVQRDEADPLGSTMSVVRVLAQLGLPIQDDAELRNKFLLSSTTFSPSLFLSQVHASASTQDLLQGLDVLSKSIDQKSASLKVLVESNFERFVRAKRTIDNVYQEMKYRGIEPEPELHRRTHSRRVSKNSFRGSSGDQVGMANPALDSQKKNALTKESEYGVLGIKTPLLDVSAKAEEVWGPALGGREREDSLKALSTTVERYKEYYECNGAVADAIKRKDYEALVEEYAKARRFADDAKKLTEDLGDNTPTDSQIRKILLAARLWHDVEEQIKAFKRDVWRKLSAMQNLSPKPEGSVGSPPDQHMELIGILLELGVADNPVTVWLFSRYDYLKNKIQMTSERSKIEIEIERRRLASGPKPTSQTIALHLRSVGHLTSEESPASIDTAEVVELWEKIYSFMHNMLSAQGILGEVLDFWNTVQSFIEGKAQEALPVGINGDSRRHHRLSEQGTIALQKGTAELIDMVRDCVFALFVDPPVEDISALFSPLASSPTTPGGAMTPSALRGMSIEPNELPPPSVKRGDAWEKFAFWPPWSNCVSGVHYLGKLLTLVGTGTSEMASIGPVGNGDGQVLERLRNLVGSARERSVTAICASWTMDADNIKYLEDWRRSPEQRDLTRMPNYFGSFEGAILTGMQKILYISEAVVKPNSADVVLPPPAKLLQMVRSQFVTTLFRSLSGMVENAEKAVKKAEDDWTTDAGGLASPVAMVVATSIGAGTVNASDRNVRMLLTLSNLRALRVTIVPNLTTQFENAFSVKLTDESATIRNALGQIDKQLFDSYTHPAIQNVRTIIRNGISSSNWAPDVNEKPRQVRDYVNEVLLSLVLVHSQVSTTATVLTNQVLAHLLEEISRELLEAFKQRRRYTLSSLMQATLDVEFIAQTLNQYSTPQASEMQSMIYQELDNSTDTDSRMLLQNELPEMRAVLKGLREGSRSEFACFRKPRTRGERTPITPTPTNI